MPDNEKSLSAFTPLVMTLVASVAVALLWFGLREDQHARVESIVASASYADRAELARQLMTQLRALDRVRRFWTEYGLTPVEEWEADAMIEIDHFEGLEALAWAERSGPRFFSTGPQIALDNVPNDEEWEVVQSSLEQAYGVSMDAVVGPQLDSEGDVQMRLYLPSLDPGRDAVLVAIINVTDQVAAIMTDEPPRYDIRVTCCEDLEIFRIGEFDADVPEQWKHGGLIEPLDGHLWRVQHQPNPSLASDFRPWALNFVLITGLALALAVGAIAYYSRRADDRARAARLAENEVRALNAELEERVRQRTQNLDDALTDLNTINLSVAHDVRTPLHAAGLMVDSLALYTEGDAHLSERVDRIRLCLGQIDTMLDRLLALSQVSSFDTEPEQVDLETLARQVALEVAENGDSSITIGDIPSAYMDPTMAHILLSNLVSNAVRHGGGDSRTRIEIGSRRDGTEVTYFVRDHGAGIDPDKFDELFAPGQRSRVARHSGDGLGLGLAIVARIIARHEGSIWVEETDGGGATFCFRIPAESKNT
jgi:signal transduction histidine kinase